MFRFLNPLDNFNIFWVLLKQHKFISIVQISILCNHFILWLQTVNLNWNTIVTYKVEIPSSYYLSPHHRGSSLFCLRKAKGKQLREIFWGCVQVLFHKGITELPSQIYLFVQILEVRGSLENWLWQITPLLPFKNVVIRNKLERVGPENVEIVTSLGRKTF